LSTLTIIRDAFLQLEEVPLGCFVLDVTEPGQDYWPENPTAFPLDQVSIRSITNLNELLENEKGMRLSSKLTHFFSNDIGTQRQTSLKLIADKATAYSLKHPRSHFLRTCGDEATKRWMENTMKHS